MNRAAFDTYIETQLAPALLPGDVVIAEDPLIQVWYAGPIDYWFRRWGDMYRFLPLWLSPRPHWLASWMNVFNSSCRIDTSIRMTSSSTSLQA